MLVPSSEVRAFDVRDGLNSDYAATFAPATVVPLVTCGRHQSLGGRTVDYCYHFFLPCTVYSKSFCNLVMKTHRSFSLLVPSPSH